MRDGIARLLPPVAADVARAADETACSRPVDANANANANASARAPPPEILHEPYSLAWFESQPWTFAHSIDRLRVVNNTFIKNHVSDDWRGRLILNQLSTTIGACAALSYTSSRRELCGTAV